MKLRKKLISTLLSVLMIMTLITGIGDTQKVLAASGDFIKIIYPEEGNIIPKDIVFRGDIFFSNTVKTHTVTYKDSKNVTQTVNPTVYNDFYTATLKDIASGSQTITYTAIDSTGYKLTKIVNVTVAETNTNILSKSVNIQPYFSDKNQYKNYLKSKNAISAEYAGIEPKNNAYVDTFINILFEESEAEGIRADVVLAQILLETGSLTQQGDVSSTQNNFGGIGAIGGGIKGNVFADIREGIRVNVQHLLAYAKSSGNPVNTIVDPRFGYVSRGISPTVEELGAFENLQMKGWAYSPQYGQKLLKIMKELTQAPKTTFTRSTTAPIFNEITAKKLYQQSSNPLDMMESSTILPGETVRLASSTNSDVETKYVVTLNGVTIFSRDWSKTPTAKFTAIKQGRYNLKTIVRNVGSKEEVSKYTTFTVGNGSNSISFNEVTISSGPYVVNKDIDFDIKIDADLSNEGEFKVQEAIGQSFVDRTSWSQNKQPSVTPTTVGTKTYRVISRNKNTPDEIDDTKTFNVTVTDPLLRKPAYLSYATISDAPYYINTPILFTGISSYSDVSYEYSLDDMTSGLPVRVKEWTTDNKLWYTPNTLGKKIYRLNSRNKLFGGSIDDSRNFVVTVTNKVVNAPKAYLNGADISDGPYIVDRNIYLMPINYLSDSSIYEYSVDDMTSGKAIRIADWTTDRKLAVMPKTEGKKIYRLNSRNRFVAGEIEDSRNFNINVTSVNTNNTKAYLNGVDVSAGPYYLNNPISIKAINYYAQNIYEYSVDDMTSGSPVRIVDWTTNSNLTIIPKATGKRIYRVNSRNRYTAGEIEDSRNVVVTIGKYVANATKAYLNGVNISSGPYLVGKNTYINPINYYSDNVYEYSIDDVTDGKAIRVVEWTTENTLRLVPEKVGKRIYRVNSRNKFVSGEIEDSRNLVMNVTSTNTNAKLAYLNGADISQGSYYTTSPITVTAINYNSDSSIYEYSLDELVNGQYIRVIEWTNNPKLTFYPNKAGKKIYTVNSRNRFVGDKIENSRSFFITVIK